MCIKWVSKMSVFIRHCLTKLNLMVILLFLKRFNKMSFYSIVQVNVQIKFKKKIKLIFLLLFKNCNFFKSIFYFRSFIELCSSIECYLGATCKVDLNYKQPYCDCEQFHCNSNLITNKPHHSTAANSNRTQLVCGSDNKTYSLCELKKTSCLRQKRIEILYYSACVNKKKSPDSKPNHSNGKLTAIDKSKFLK